MSSGTAHRPTGSAPAPSREAGDLDACLLGQLGVKPAGQDRVDLDLVGGPGQRQALGELDDPALARRVGRGEPGAEDRGHATDVHDLPATGPLHRRIDRLREQEGAGEVHVQDLLPVLQAHLLRRLADVDARIVKEDVDPSESGLDLRGDPRQFVGDRDVGDHRQGLDARVLGELRSRRPGSSRGSGRTTATFAPAAARPRAIPRPIPPLPPVTIATFPLRSNRFTSGISSGSSPRFRLGARRRCRQAIGKPGVTAARNHRGQPIARRPVPAIPRTTPGATAAMPDPRWDALADILSRPLHPPEGRPDRARRMLRPRRHHPAPTPVEGGPARARIRWSPPATAGSSASWSSTPPSPR